MRFELRAMLWFLLSCTMLPAQAASETKSMRYLVFDWNEANEPVLIFHRRIAVAETRASTMQANVSYPGISVKLGQVDLNRQVGAAHPILHVPADLNGEFHEHVIDAAPQAFVVRASMADDDSLELMYQGRNFRFELKAVAPVPELQALAASAAAAKLTPPANRVDILVVGEGYTAAQQAKFDADVALFEQGFFAISPYRGYRNFTTLNKLFVASAQSGADHPRYRSDCANGAPSCCADAYALNDPAAGQQVNTAFDGTYCTANVHRLLTVDYGKVLTAASAAPEWDFIFVLVNDPVYGGSGGGFSVTSTGSGSASIVVHEYGHSFTLLADEYNSPYPGYPPCSDLEVAGTFICEANVTDDTRRHRLKWRHFVDPLTLLPTPLGTLGTGLFEGARYQPVGMFRPQQDICQMRQLSGQFCSVCNEAYILRMYNGNWGAPSAGISLIEPGSEMPDTGNVIDLASSNERILRAELLRLEHALEVFWRVNGRRVEGISDAQLNLDSLNLQSGLNRIELRVIDPNPAVRSGKAGAMAQQRVWQVAVNDEGANDLLVNPMGLSGLWYEPATSGQGVNLHFLDERHFILTFYGFERNGDRLWLIADYSGNIAYDTLLHFDLIEVRGGVFEHLDPAVIDKTIWGSGQLRFIDCEHAELQMTGNDGSQTLAMVKLAGIAGLNCHIL